MESYLDIYTLNDFHGAIFEKEDEPGISKLGNFLLERKRVRPDATVILSAGDMFQGTAVSSLTKGDVVVDIMNYIGFDAMTIGNHEFDWGVKQLCRLFDGNPDNNETDFPLLGANICNKTTLEPVEWARPYTIIERLGLKIGIIGVLGEDLKNDILGSIIEEYIFTNQLATIKKYTRTLRAKEGCRIVIVVSHYDTSPINGQIACLPDEEKVDVVINGHTHNYYAGELSGVRQVPLPYIQSGNSGKYVGNIRIYLDAETKEIYDVSCENLQAVKHCINENTEINRLLDKYRAVVAIANEVLAIAAEDIYRLSASLWAADALRKGAGSDIGLINNGGIRADAFPITKETNVTYGHIFRIMPFENRIVTVELSGVQIKYLIFHAVGNKLTFSSNVDINNGTVNGKVLRDEVFYRISTVDFVYEAPAYRMNTGCNLSYSDDLFRDLLVEEVKITALNNNGKWFLR